MVDLAELRRQLVAPLRGRLVLLGVGPLGAYTNLLTQLREDGVDVLVVATAVSDEEEQAAEDLDVPHVFVHVPPAPSLSASIRAEQALLDDLPSEVVEAVDTRDPDRRGVWLGHAFLEREELLGRQVLGGRRREWGALEDKTRCDRLFDAVGAPRPPSVTVPVELEALLSAASDLDEGDGTVWSGDSSAGVNGGADLVRWVRSREDAEDAVRLLAAQCRAARVAPFVEGVPCSTHGIVLPDGVAVGRPVELVNLRSVGGSSFVYAGLSTWWDPPDDDRETMCDVARRVGAYLAGEHGYAGAFGLDGVLGKRGWVLTELNTRASTGLALIMRAVPDLPFGHLQRALVAGLPPGLTAAELQQLTSAADDVRAGAVRAFSRRPGSGEMTVTGGPGGLAPSPEDGQAVGRLLRTPTAVGSLVELTLEDGVVTEGDRLAGWAVAALALADDRWATGFGPTEAAPAVH